ncbi:MULTISPECIES: PucR family transcriptional regulator [unclassified Streptomyces]|uniref:PucR family transcriptional regulator n=1 Tax=unclassified Streptomyces TaxID=2593676 RepID=UPI0028C46273|nr:MULTISPECIES: PucR family transcriptional regulator [unclassified Streptomyces]WNO71979.1 PucR family transcriptional regulator [Streptomyces sp. AM8-1-1]
MPPTLASLVQHSALKLTVRSGEDRLETPVRWAHVSELADPVPYMEGGELLLVTAMTLDAEDPEAMRRYVRRLVGAGVVGLGFAVGVYYEDIPDALLDAAKAEDFPLLAVPRRTPFLAISKAVSAAIAADQYRAVTAGFEVQRELTRAALAEGPGAVVAKLAAHVDGWAALYDASGSVVAASPEWAARRAARLTGDVERLRERAAPASAVVGDTDDDRVELQSLGSGRRVRGALAVGTGAPLGTASRYAVHSAVALLTLSTERSRAFQEAEQRLGAAVLRMLLSGQPDHARAVAGDLYGGLLDAPFRLLIAEPAGEQAPGAEQPLQAFADMLESAAARAAEPVLAVPDTEDRLVVLAADGGAVVTACTAAYGEQESDDAALVVGLSAPTGPIAAAGAYKQCEQALSVARRRGRALVEHEELAAGSILPLLADDAVRAFADGMLRALYEHDATGRGDLVASLRAWLSRHGQWDAAAADLGVHRHTLRYRMRRVEEILGRSLDDPDVRMELWLALKTSAGSA